MSTALLPDPSAPALPSASGHAPSTAATPAALLTPAVAGLGAALLSACGGQSADDATTDPQRAVEARQNLGLLPAPHLMDETAAARFLTQAGLGASRAQIAQVRVQGFSAWIDAQCALPSSGTRWDWLIAKGFNAAANINTENGFDAAMWRKLITAPDVLRQRVALALSEIMVIGIDGLVGAGWKAFSAAAYMDLLEANAFGNFRTLLGSISTSPAMGQFLTFRGNSKANPATGSHPDENYARELMQLMTIGLVQLNADGTPKLKGGVPQYTYAQQDVSELARIFTGWDFDLAGSTTATPDFLKRPMKQVPSRHETGSSTILGKTVPGSLTAAAALDAALDILFAHPNVAPFIGRQLIQKLVTSNPSPAYVGRVSAVFNDDGSGVRGNLRAVVKAILLDSEARQSPDTPGAGKLREPMLRLVAWARAFNVHSASDAWAIGNTSDPASRLGQSPLRSASVFNFFRPGYVPPNSAIAGAGLEAPEFQLTNESSVVGYVNFMQRMVSTGIGDVLADYSALLPLADNAASLLADINTVLAAGQIGAATQALMLGALNGMAHGSDAARRNRIYAALTMVLAAPEFLVQK
jgi:uncharacterized protein (DUF1800 family)